MAASWESYIDSMAQYAKSNDGTNHIDSGAIYGLEGGLWGKKAFGDATEITQETATQILKEINDKNFVGFIHGGIKYQTIRVEDDDATAKALHGKKKEYGAVYAETTNTTIVIAHMPEGKQPGNMNKGVGEIAKYLRSLGM
jgi:hypothetical protein